MLRSPLRNPAVFMGFIACLSLMAIWNLRIAAGESAQSERKK